MDDGIHLGGTDDAGQDRVGLVGPDELCALQGDGRLAGAHAENHLDFGIRLQGLRHAASPEAVEPRDEDAPPHVSAEPDAAPLAQHLVEGLLKLHPDRFRLLHDSALGVALLGGRHIERHGVEDPELEFGRESRGRARGVRTPSCWP